MPAKKMLKKSAKVSHLPRPRSPQEPFHEALGRLRWDALLSEVTLAEAAGCTVAEYRSVEEGKLPCSQAIYDAATTAFGYLSIYPRPGSDPKRIEPQTHKAIEYEYERISPLLEEMKVIRLGRDNRFAVGRLLKAAADGRITPKDIERFFG